jgi:photosystem I subunit 10
MILTRNIAFLWHEYYSGERTLTSSILLALQATVPNTPSVSPQGIGIMIAANLFCLLVLSRLIWYPHVGAKMPLPFPSLFNNPSVGTFLACMSAGHLLGVGMILGLGNLGILQ